MSSITVPKVNIADAHLQFWPLPVDWVEQGNPTASGVVLSKSDDSRVVRGVWECTPGKFRWNFTYDETVIVVKGRATVELESGETISLNPGDRPFFGRGQWSTWPIIEPLRRAF